MYLYTIKSRAKDLRKQGKTFTEIQKLLKLNVPKGTLSYWFKGLPIPISYVERVKRINLTNLKKARVLAVKVNKTKRLKFLTNLKNVNLGLLKKLDLNTQKLLLSVLYLAEGAKHKSSQFLALASSDPSILRFYMKLLKNCFKVNYSKFRVRIQCRADQNVISLERFWSNLTKIPKKQFYPTYKDTRTIGKPTQKGEYKGVCTIIYFDTKIQLELEFLAEAVIKSLV